MLSGHQCETIAFIRHGEIICPDCAVEATSPRQVAMAENGHGYGGDELSALSRYSLDEYTGERTWEYAEERVREFEARHPVMWAALIEARPDAEWRLTDRVADRQPYVEPCGHCGRDLD